SNTRAIWEVPRNFEPRSDLEDDNQADTFSPSCRTTLAAGRLAPYDLTCIRSNTRRIFSGI
ncbi:Homeobox protein homothorax, partial [Araneus ventricosus]